MQCTNIDLERMLASASAHLGRRDLIGYACARNVRAIRDELAEFIEVKNEMLAEYGEVGESGVPYIAPSSPRYDEFLRRYEPIALARHDLAIMPLRYTDVVGELTGEEILQIDWMLED